MAFSTPARITAVGMLTGVFTFAAMVIPGPAKAWDTAVWDRVALCEASGNWSINTGNGFHGGLQFTPSTWAGFGGAEYATRADLATKDEQIAIARRVLEIQGPGAWPVCSVKAGLNKTNGGADANAVPDGISRSGVRTVATGTSPTSVVRVADEQGPDANMSLSTIRLLQEWVGADADGIIGPRTSRALQARVGAPQTGRIDETTVRQLQQLVGADVDGDWGPQTTRCVEAHLDAVL